MIEGRDTAKMDNECIRDKESKSEERQIWSDKKDEERENEGWEEN